MIKIIGDSTCDLSEEVLEKYNISFAPLKVNIDGKDYRDRFDIKPAEFYPKLETYEEYPKTSMPNPKEYIKLFHEAVDAGYNKILCICMSSGTSGSYQSAVIAKDYFLEEIENQQIDIEVIDSYSMSHGTGYLILKSAIYREKGMSFQEIIKFNKLYRKNIKHFLAVDDLDHLIKSGRLSNASAMIGKILKLKPIMSMKNKKGAIVAKVRGKKGVLRHYIKEYNKRVDPKMTDFIIIGYTSDINIAKALKIRIEEKTVFDGKIYIMQMGVSVGTHVGLGGISMYFIEKNHLKDGLLTNEKEKFLELVEKFKEVGHEYQS